MLSVYSFQFRKQNKSLINADELALILAGFMKNNQLKLSELMRCCRSVSFRTSKALENLKLRWCSSLPGLQGRCPWDCPRSRVTSPLASARFPGFPHDSFSFAQILVCNFSWIIIPMPSFFLPEEEEFLRTRKPKSYRRKRGTWLS